MLTLYTIGHGNRDMDEFITTLQHAGIRTLVDIRAHPASRKYPRFNADSLSTALEAVTITYHLAGRHLGGYRKPAAGSPHKALRSEGLRAYADHMDTKDFQIGAAQLINLARRAPCAILCAERSFAQCHRSLIADYLTLQGMRVIHLLAPGEQVEHQLSPFARRESARLVYDRHSQDELPVG